MSADSSAAAMNDLNAAAASSRKRPRHFWDGPDPADDEEKQSAAHASPVSRLYQHALESVFGFLSLADLSHAMAVSHSWSVAVLRMPCARFRSFCRSENVVSLSSSSLSAHVTAITHSAEPAVERDLSSDQLYVLALRMPQLTALDCAITQAAANKVILPPKLKRLKIDLSKLTDAAIEAVIRGISQLTALVKLELALPSFLPAISFSPLSAVASLQEFDLGSCRKNPQPTALQLDQLRAMPQLRRMVVIGLSSQSLVQLLRTPHELRWQQIYSVWSVDVVVSAALSTLPSLTALRACHCSDVGFLAHLVQLRKLDLHMAHHPWPATITADAVVDGLSCCAQLTDLKITTPLNSKHLGTLLPRLALLTKLRLECMYELESLACLSHGPVVHRLRSLELDGCCNAALRSSELKHVYALAALEKLTLTRSFVESLTPLEQFLHTPPSLLLPKLNTFTYTAPFSV